MTFWPQVYTTQLLSHGLIIITNLIELATANNEYSAKLASGKGTDKVLRTLAWNIEDLSRLNEDGRKMRIESKQICELAEGSEERFVALNAARRLSLLRKKMLEFLQGLYRFRRQAATHVFVLMISPEQRDRKPYAIPVQCTPYVSLKHSTCRNLVNSLIAEMHQRGMKVAGVYTVTYCIFIMCHYFSGFTSNGEFNSLRCTGNTRPLTVLQLKANCRSKYAALGKKALVAMLTPNCK